jgi:hypothetical protein
MKVETPKGIRAYHSSPHDFDKFDLAKIGSGEGAQVYGHGLYFAESPAVSGAGGEYWKQFARRFQGPDTDPAVVHAVQMLEASNGNRAAALAKGEAALKGDYRGTTLPDAVALLRSDKPVGPRTYEVNINADPAHMLDWDKPFASPDALEAFASKFDAVNPTTRRFLEDYSYANTKAGRALPDGEDIFRELKALSSPKQFSNEFREAGIPGIKYLDQGSRAQVPTYRISKTDADNARYTLSRTDHMARDTSNKGFMTYAEAQAAQAAAEAADAARRTSNYVIFDPNIIRIDKKYAVPGAIGAGGMGALAAQNQYEEVY